MPKLVFLFLILLLRTTAYADSTLVKKINDITSAVKKMYAADKRVAFFESVTDLERKSIHIATTEKGSIEDFKKQIIANNISLQVFADLLPASDLNDSIYGVSTLSVSNNRSAPHHFAELTTQMLLGTPIEVLKRDRGYYLVRTPDNYLSWVDRAGIKLMTRKEFNSWKAAKKVIYTADYGHSYLNRSKSAIRVSDLVQGNILTLIGKSGGYYKVAYPDDRIAFIPRKYAQEYNKWVKRPDPDSGKILESAKALLGVPYLWGGTSNKGLDCSGFTKTSYFLNGIILPRDASQQALVGDPVDISQQDTVNLEKGLKNLLPGDLLFFATTDKSMQNNSRITHTAIYMGNGEFIQSAGLVKINSLIPGAPNYDQFHRRTLVAARRMLTAIGTAQITRIDHHSWYIPENE